MKKILFILLVSIASTLSAQQDKTLQEIALLNNAPGIITSTTASEIIHREIPYYIHEGYKEKYQRTNYFPYPTEKKVQINLKVYLKNNETGREWKIEEIDGEITSTTLNKTMLFWWILSFCILFTITKLEYKNLQIQKGKAYKEEVYANYGSSYRSEKRKLTWKHLGSLVLYALIVSVFLSSIYWWLDRLFGHTEPNQKIFLPQTLSLFALGVLGIISATIYLAATKKGRRKKRKQRSHSTKLA